ncbi:hypothetical protein ASF30_11700 [Leifsonia sp. Leaf264]|nr:hypothetical protein ASF30_11700 [Leifsonia sp. Leaf264]
MVALHGLTHIGTLNQEYKKDWSYEGQGLSVSMDPDAWEQIAELGGNPRWSVGVDNPQFLDFHELTAEQKDAINDWGVERGYVIPVTATRIYTWDSEDESWRYYLTTDESDVEFERDEAEAMEYEVREGRPMDGEDEDGFVYLDSEATFATTDVFPDPTVRRGSLGEDQILATLWVQETTDFDGVWWEDDYDPERLSAPRGVIVPRAIQKWVASAVEADQDS